MNSEELAKLVPWIVAEKLEDATSPTPVMPGPMHDEAPAWSFRCGPVLTVASIHPDENELRLTLGLAINIPYTTDVSHHVNRFNHHDLVFGRAFLIGNEESGRGAVAYARDHVRRQPILGISTFTAEPAPCNRDAFWPGSAPRARAFLTLRRSAAEG